QAEDGIRDRTVTGVQTCALPISQSASARTICAAATSRGSRITRASWSGRARGVSRSGPSPIGTYRLALTDWLSPTLTHRAEGERSEERRVGKECRPGCVPYAELE